MIMLNRDSRVLPLSSGMKTFCSSLLRFSLKYQRCPFQTNDGQRQTPPPNKADKRQVLTDLGQRQPSSDPLASKQGRQAAGANNYL